MLYFSIFDKIRLVNGYSAHSTVYGKLVHPFDNHTGEGVMNVIENIKANHIDSFHVVFYRQYYDKEMMSVLRNLGKKIVLRTLGFSSGKLITKCYRVLNPNGTDKLQYVRSKKDLMNYYYIFCEFDFLHYNFFGGVAWTL